MMKYSLTILTFLIVIFNVYSLEKSTQNQNNTNIKQDANYQKYLKTADPRLQKYMKNFDFKGLNKKYKKKGKKKKYTKKERAARKRERAKRKAIRKKNMAAYKKEFAPIEQRMKQLKKKCNPKDESGCDELDILKTKQMQIACKHNVMPQACNNINSILGANKMPKAE